MREYWTTTTPEELHHFGICWMLYIDPAITDGVRSKWQDESTKVQDAETSDLLYWDLHSLI